MKLYNLNINKIENGFIVEYVQDNKSKRRAFYTWAELVIWLGEQNQEPVPVKSAD